MFIDIKVLVVLENGNDFVVLLVCNLLNVFVVIFDNVSVLDVVLVNKVLVI